MPSPEAAPGRDPRRPKNFARRPSLAAAAAGVGRGGGGPSTYGAGGHRCGGALVAFGDGAVDLLRAGSGRRPRSAAATALSRAHRLSHGRPMREVGQRL